MLNSYSGGGGGGGAASRSAPPCIRMATKKLNRFITNSCFRLKGFVV